MKFFPPKKKDENADKKEASTVDNSDQSKEKSSQEQKDKTVKDSESTKKSWFGKSKPSDKTKQNETKGTANVTADEKSTKSPSQQLTTAQDQPKAPLETKEQVIPNNPSGQQTTVQLDQSLSESDEIRKLFEIVSTSKESSIKPTLDFEENILTFPLLSSLGNNEYVSALLEKLASPSVNILEKVVHERLAVCPDHPQNLATTLRLYCSACSSTDIIKLHLIEHKLCGYITEKKDFGGSFSDMTKCISCKNTIKDPQKEMRRLGRWYECNKCKTRFDNCVLKLHCRKFDHDFDVNQASMVVIPSYNLKVDAKSVQIYSVSLLPQIKKALESYEFVVEESSTVKGKSGIAHKTSLYAKNNQNKTVVIDLKVSEGAVEDTEVNSMIVKVLDISPTMSIFIGIPSVSDSAKAMAAASNVSIITGNNLSEILSSVEQIIKTRLLIGNEPNKN